MRKQEFLDELAARLSNLPKDNLNERLDFYREMIEDRMEEGLSEEEAVAAAGSIDRIVAQIASDRSLPIIKEKVIVTGALSDKWKMALLVIGSPIWLSLIIALAAVGISLVASVFAVAVSLYATIWSLVITLCAVFVAFAASTPLGALLSVIYVANGDFVSSMAYLSAALVLAGLAIFAFLGIKPAFKGAIWLSKNIWYGFTGTIRLGGKLCAKLKNL